MRIPHATVRYHLGEIAYMRGCYDMALDDTRAALSLFSEVLPQTHPQIIRTKHRLALIAERRGQIADSRASFDFAIESLRAAGRADSLDHALILAESARPLGVLGEHTEALARAKNALEIVGSLPEADERSKAIVLAGLAAAQARAGQRDEARASLALSLRLMAEIAGGDQEDMPPGLLLLAELALDDGDMAVARRHAERAHRILVARRAAPDRVDEVVRILKASGGPVPLTEALTPDCAITPGSDQ